MTELPINPDPVIGKITLNLHQSGAVIYSCPNEIAEVMRATSQAFLHMAGSYLMRGPDFLRMAMVVCALALQAAVGHNQAMQGAFRQIQEAQPEAVSPPMDDAPLDPGKKPN
jgi:hypothetical protein